MLGLWTGLAWKHAQRPFLRESIRWRQIQGYIDPVYSPFIRVNCLAVLDEFGTAKTR
jgi:hypothetical protein